MFRILLILTPDEEIADPAWEQVEEALGGVQPDRSVILYRPDGQHIRADGARFMFTIVYYQNAEASPFMVGRPPNGKRRGRATLDGNWVVVTPWENWAPEDAVEVFRKFFDGKELTDRFLLRDPEVALSDDEIAKIIQGPT